MLSQRSRQPTTQSTRPSALTSSNETTTDAESVPVSVLEVLSMFITDSSGVTEAVIERTTWYLFAETVTISSTPTTTGQ